MSNSFLQVHYYLKFSKAIGYQEHVWFSKIPQKEPAGKVCLVTRTAVDVMVMPHLVRTSTKHASFKEEYCNQGTSGSQENI